MVKTLRVVSKLFYRQKYTHYACTLETVAAVPGMVAGMFQHLRALRKMEPNFWVKTLLDEAENERMHLMSFVQLTKPSMFALPAIVPITNLPASHCRASVCIECTRSVFWSFCILLRCIQAHSSSLHWIP